MEAAKKSIKIMLSMDSEILSQFQLYKQHYQLFLFKGVRHFDRSNKISLVQEIYLFYGLIYLHSAHP